MGLKRMTPRSRVGCSTNEAAQHPKTWAFLLPTKNLSGRFLDI